MQLVGTVEDIYDDIGYLKFKLEESLECIELPVDIFEDVRVDSRYRITLTELPLYDRDNRKDD